MQMMMRAVKVYAIGTMLLAVAILLLAWPSTLLVGAMATDTGTPEAMRGGAMIVLTPIIIALSILIATPFVYWFPWLQIPAAIIMTGLFAASFYFSFESPSLYVLTTILRMS